MESDTSRLSRTVSGTGAATAAPGCWARGAHTMTAVAMIQAPIRPPRTTWFVLTSRPPRWLYGSRRRASLRVRLDHGHIVLSQDFRDLSASAADHRIERRLERLVAMAHGHPPVQPEPQSGD